MIDFVKKGFQVPISGIDMFDEASTATSFSQQALPEGACWRV